MHVPTPATALLVGGTGRTGRRVLAELLKRGVRVRAIVRSKHKLDLALLADPNLALVEADLSSLGDEELRRQVEGSNAIVSCLGHVISFRGVFGPPRDLVTGATARLCRAVELLEPAQPVRFILMTSVSVHQSRDLDPRRGAFERAFLCVLRALVPPAKDNQRAADHLRERIGREHRFLEWVVVRPDSLLDGEVSEYAVHPSLVHSLASPGHSRMANVAHFMCELVTDPKTWADWRSRLPVIVDASSRRARPA